MAKILIVDDNEDRRIEVEDALSKDKHEVVTVDNTEAALKLMCPYDLLITNSIRTADEAADPQYLTKLFELARQLRLKIAVISGAPMFPVPPEMLIPDDTIKGVVDKVNEILKGAPPEEQK